jgi:glyoxylase-like metal-dependent hydrolase (beta-lactamase superfamily II)
MSAFMLGNLQIDEIEELPQVRTFSPKIWFPDLPDDAVVDNQSWFAPHHYDSDLDLMVMSIRSWLVRTKHHNILIDCCFGNDKARPDLLLGDHLNTPWIGKLAGLGLQPEDIDFVMCTHLHADHVGWNTRLIDGRWVPTFPNARYIFGRAEYDFWNPMSGEGMGGIGQEGVFQDSVLPCVEAGLVDLVDGGFTIDDALSVEDAPGHSPATMIIRADGGKASGVFVGDIVHSPIQLPYPDCNSVACQNPDLARASRRRVLEDCATHNRLLLPAHFASPQNRGFVACDGDKFRFLPS